MATEMPHDAAAEKAVLSAMLASPSIADDVLASGISAADFFTPSHALIFEAVAAMRADGKVPDQISLRDRLESSGDLERAGGEAGIIGLFTGAPVFNWKDHAAIVRRKALARGYVAAGARVQALGYDAPEDVDELRASAEEAVLSVTGPAVGRACPPARAMEDAWEMVKELGDPSASGVMTGFRSVDALVGGMKPGQLIVLGARTSVGKTALALQVAMNASERGADAVAVFELEMERREVMSRMICSRADVPTERFKRNQKLTEREFSEVRDFAEWFAKSGVWIDDSPETTVAELSAAARRIFRDVPRGRGLVVVDYLNLMGSERQAENRQAEVAQISRSLKLAAKSLGQPILALAQLSRQVDGRAGKTPVLSDLRESGAIEQDADIVMFLDRSKTEEEARETGRPPFGEARVIVAKNRSGALGTARLGFDEERARFSDLG